VILDLVTHSDPVLYRAAQGFDFAHPPFDPIEFANNLVETMLARRGLGLSGPQVGIPYRVFSVASDPCGVFYNPKIVSSSEATTELVEGCLTFPGLFLKIKRHRIIRLRYTLPNGSTMTKQFSDFTSRVMQHEIDHLDGITIIGKQEGLKRSFAKKKWAKIVALDGGVRIKFQPEMVDMISAAEAQLSIENKVREANDKAGEKMKGIAKR